MGSENRLHLTMSGFWGEDEKTVRSQYEDIREALKEVDGTDIGPPDDKFLVFYDDLGACHEYCDHGGPGEFNKRFSRECDLLNNWPGIGVPMHQAAKRLWDRVRIPFAEAVARIGRGRGEGGSPGSDGSDAG